MDGKIATLSRNNKQVGGLIDWHIWVKDIPEPGFTPAKTSGIAKGYWLFEELGPGEFDARFYDNVEGQLVEVSAFPLIADFQSCVTDKLIRHEFRFDAKQ